MVRGGSAEGHGIGTARGPFGEQTYLWRQLVGGEASLDS